MKICFAPTDYDLPDCIADQI